MTLAPPHMETPTASSFVQSNAVEEEDISYPVARTLFAFDATSQFELSIKGQNCACFTLSLETQASIEGELVRVLEPDDGSGWVKVQDPEGNDGLVPASYIEHAEEEEEAGPSGLCFRSQEDPHSTRICSASLVRLPGSRSRRNIFWGRRIDSIDHGSEWWKKLRGGLVGR